MADFSTRVHLSLLRVARSKGAAISFSTPNTDVPYDETDEDEAPPTDAAGPVTGFAVEILGDPEEYAALELIQSSPVTLIFALDVQGDPLPGIGNIAFWAGEVRTVRAQNAIRPAGIALGAKLVLA